MAAKSTKPVVNNDSAALAVQALAVLQQQLRQQSETKDDLPDTKGDDDSVTHPGLSCRLGHGFIGFLAQCITVETIPQHHLPEATLFMKKGPGVFRKFFISKDLKKLGIFSRSFAVEEIEVSRGPLNFTRQNAFTQKTCTWTRMLKDAPKHNASYQSYARSNDISIYRGKSKNDTSVYFTHSAGARRFKIFRIPIERLCQVFAHADMFREQVMRTRFHKSHPARWLLPHQMGELANRYRVSEVPYSEWPAIMRFESDKYHEVNLWRLILEMWLGDRRLGHEALVPGKFVLW